MNTIQIRSLNILGTGALIGLLIVSVFGSFFPETYIRDSATMAAQGKGQDLVNLFIVCPVLLISIFLINRRSRTGYFLFGGTILYLLYSFVIYAMGVHFNQLFLLYCLVLGTSGYALTIFISSMSKLPVSAWLSTKKLNLPIALFLFIIAFLFFALWMKDLLPAIIINTIPQSITEAGLLVNPIHVLDLSFALPGLVLTGILLIRKNNLGYVLAPIWLIFCLHQALALVGMMINMRIEGITEDGSLVYLFSALALISLGFFLWFSFSARSIREIRK